MIMAADYMQVVLSMIMAADYMQVVLVLRGRHE